MAKSKEKHLTRKLRKKGLSIKEIAKKVGVSKSSVSFWCSDIVLTKQQALKLHNSMVRGSYAGRMAGVRMQKDRKKKKIEDCLIEAKKEISSVSKRDLFIAGLALYWGEGTKNNSDVRFCNSNKTVIEFIMKWFRNSLNIQDGEFRMYVGINEIHKDRLSEVLKYWSQVTNIPIEQFRKPVLFKVNNKKTYENFSNHYGTLTVRISKSKYLLYKILSLIEVLGAAG
ncbi:MAG: helix-turn-helix transcriptional regulator [bacterium]